MSLCNIPIWKNKTKTKFECNLKHSKANFFTLGNKADALLARQVKVQRLKAKMFSLHHPTSTQLWTKPQNIANTFSDYYASQYNLKHDSYTLQPTEVFFYCSSDLNKSSMIQALQLY